MAYGASGGEPGPLLHARISLVQDMSRVTRMTCITASSVLITAELMLMD